MTPGHSTDDGHGVELWVAITILLGVTLVAVAVTAGFLWTITPPEDGHPAPNANFDSEQETTTLTVDAERVEVTRVTFRHEGGDEIDPQNLEVRMGSGPSHSLGLGADGAVAAFETDAVSKGDEVAVVATARLDREEAQSGVSFTVESVDGERRLTDGNGTVLELEPGDEVRLIWTDGERAATLRLLEVEDRS